MLDILLGYHQFIFHPITLWLAYRKYIGKPTKQHIICFFLHDIGYITMRSRDMDTENDNHPELGAKIAGKILGEEWYNYCLYHSRDYAQKDGVEPSELCWIDKLSLEFDPLMFATIRCMISGILKTRNPKKVKSLIITWREKAISDAGLHFNI